ncbi:hypothetical protein [Mycobacterium sp.]|uniref:hypothetical protein n=1 Tax=Mycobacterium sp. TaxID=1785 RepID=UPI003C727F0A
MSESLRGKIFAIAVMLIFFGLIGVACGVANKSSDPTCNGHKMTSGQYCHFTESHGFDTTGYDRSYSEMKNAASHGSGVVFIVAGSAVAVVGAVTIFLLVRKGGLPRK